MKKEKVKEYVTKHKKLIVAMAATTTVACGAAVTYMLTRRTPSKDVHNTIVDFLKGMECVTSKASWGTFREETKLSELGKVADKVIEAGKGEFTPDTEVLGAVIFTR